MAEVQHQVPSPSASSLAFRANLGRLISPLRRVRPRVPFWKLAAHRIPTLWMLYRGLLRNAPGEYMQHKIRLRFHKNRHRTSAEGVKKRLQAEHQLLDLFLKAKHGDIRAKKITKEQERQAKMANLRSEWARLIRSAEAEQIAERLRPVWTGSYMRASLYNRPLPRMKPLPQHIRGMINYRRRAREQRQARLADIRDVQEGLRAERAMEEQLPLQDSEKVYSAPGAFKGWSAPLSQHVYALSTTFALEHDRLTTPFSSELLAKIASARRARHVNKNKERQREARGEILPATIRRRNQGPPAHILARMSPRERKLDRVARSSVSEVGYVGWAKKKLGWRLKNPEGVWRADEGRVEDRPRLDAEEARVRAENARRRTSTQSNN